MQENHEEVVVGQCYRHFKGMLYYVIGVGAHTETGETLVAYKALYGDGSVYFRPYSMFVEPVPPNRDSDNVTKQKYRFEKFDAKMVL